VAVAGQTCSSVIGGSCSGSERGSACEDEWEGEGLLVVEQDIQVLPKMEEGERSP
jgi:hypothetical protein